MNVQNHSANLSVHIGPAHLNEHYVYVDSCLRVEPKRYFIAVKGKPLKLTKTEFRLISYLACNIPNISTFENLWSFAWDRDTAINRKSIQVYVSRIRRKLAPL